jgi:hypothetical protein
MAFAAGTHVRFQTGTQTRDGVVIGRSASKAIRWKVRCIQTGKSFSCSLHNLNKNPA